ncbi:MAG: DegT/DnrJ/EryC1/StrS family aminotransferase, partial [Oligoflexia bacterium]|nr:DegT/DnrJ/EryC1/StrS family aminotransferase [Oligoflexia bacterium]
MTTMNVPFVDLKTQYLAIKEEVLPGVHKVFEKCNFILGEEVANFENDFAKFIGTKYAVGVATGTDALHLSVRALGIGPGDEVIVPANTFIATPLGVTLTGATPVPCDVEEKNFLIDINQIEKRITKKTKAIIPVHLYGRMLNMDSLKALADKYNLQIIEDVAQAHGAELDGKKAGTVGRTGCFSFFPGKNLGAYGDGGMVTTNEKELYDNLISIRNYGSPKKYYHPIIGLNSRLDTVQAVVLGVKLKRLNDYNQRRFNAAVKYNNVLEGIGDVVIPQIPEKGSHVFHLYVIRTKHRDAL